MSLAAIALDEVEAVLGTMKDAPDALLLIERWRSLQRVFLGVCAERVPLFVTEDQEAALLRRILKLAEDANDLADLLFPMEASGTRRTWSPVIAKLHSGAA
jgi:hypothetical protein